MARPVIAIVGRANVGKSTIFNRIVGGRMAIVEDKPGVTRDRLYGRAEWNGVKFSVIDTGGIELFESDELMKSIRAQAQLAIDEAAVIVFVVDAQVGITREDIEVAKLLYRSRKPVILAVNKVDNLKMQDEIYEFYKLGLGDPVSVSGVHGTGIGDLLDAALAHLPRDAEQEYDEDVIKVAVIGRPNVGKSSLVNAILGEERVIVSDIAGTTRDAVDTPFEMDGRRYVLIDTAGIRKRGRIYETTEKYSVMRAQQAIERADVTLIVLNGEEGVIEQDKHIAGYAHEAGKASVFVVNKWDAVEKDDKTMQRYIKTIRDQFQFMTYAPAAFVSARTRRRVQKLLPLIDHVADQHAMRVQTSMLNDVIGEALAMNPPPSSAGRKLRVHYGTQVAVKPPTFVLFVNDPELMHFSYERYLENRIRAAFSFEGTPLRIIKRGKSEEE